MTKPNLPSYLFGNPVSFFVISVGLIFFGWQYFATGQGGLVAVGFLIAGSYAYRANDRLRQYKNWQREWADLDETPPRRAFALPRLPGKRVIAGIIGWGILLLLAFANGYAGDPVPTVVLVLLAAVPIALLSRKFLAQMRGALGRSRSDRQVGVCLPSLKSQPSLDAAYAALPEQLWGLFAENPRR